jgi:hypothetical protein
VLRVVEGTGLDLGLEAAGDDVRAVEEATREEMLLGLQTVR